MKNLIVFGSFLAAFVCFGLNSAVAQSNMEGQAKAAFHQECNYQGSVETAKPVIVSACFVSGFITRVEIIPNINCNKVDCSTIRIPSLGYVLFGCEGDVIDVVCYGNL